MTLMSRGRLLAGAGVAGVVAVAAAMVAMPAQAKKPVLRHADTAAAVADSYIVVLKDNARAAVSAQAESLASEYGADVGRTYTTALQGFSVTATETEAQRWPPTTRSAYVQQNQRFGISDVQPDPPSWGLDRLDQRDLPLDASYTYATKADNVTAFIIDTGVMADAPDVRGPGDRRLRRDRQRRQPG